LKLIRTFGLAVIAALATIAIASAGAATADTLCKAKEDPCSKINSLSTHHHYVYVTLTKLCFQEFICIHQKWERLELTQVNNGAKKGLKGLTQSLTLTSIEGDCKKATAINLPWATEWSGSTQQLVFTSSGKGDPGVLLEGCTAMNLHCQYSAKSVTLKVAGGKPLKTSAAEVPMTKSGGSAFCPESGTSKVEEEMSEPFELVHLSASP
jgi:hypothetical protein